MEKTILIKTRKGKKYFFRFTLNQRIQHVILATCVIVLVLTGMPLKFHDHHFFSYLYAMVGGIRVAPIVHRIAGTILLLLFGFHLLYLAITIYRGQLAPLKKCGQLGLVSTITSITNLPLLPNIKDLKDIVALMKYLLFLTNERPQGGQFTWKEKFDYWAPFWGIVIIGGSGIILWSQELASRVLPGEVINFALIAHSDEALLAALFLFIWHWYNVHFSTSVFPMGTVFLTGYLPEHLMVEEHYEYYVKVMTEAGLEKEILPPHDSPKAVPSENIIRVSPKELVEADEKMVGGIAL